MVYSNKINQCTLHLNKIVGVYFLTMWNYVDEEHAPSIDENMNITCDFATLGFASGG